MHPHFLSNAKIRRNEYLLKTEDLFTTNKSSYFPAFQTHFNQTCAHIQKMQSTSTLAPISYLDYTMLYTNFINRRYTADIFAYGEKGYLDKNQRFIGEYDISFLFVYFDQLWNDLINQKRRYVGKVKSKEVTQFMLETLPDFYSYLANIARFAIAECADKSPLAEIEKNETFMINVGDYMAKTETVYMEKKTKDADKLAAWFNEQLDKVYVYGDYSHLDFSGKTFADTDFRYAQFRGSTLNNTSFAGSSLIGANFRNAHMENCSLDYCSIYEADFSFARLKNASFVNAYAKTGLPDKNEWKFVGFLPTIFCNADLTDAVFCGANLTGADFSGATLTGADFSGAVLDGAVFDTDDLALTEK